jgi:hypothetical protein
MNHLKDEVFLLKKGVVWDGLSSFYFEMGVCCFEKIVLRMVFTSSGWPAS